VLPVAAANSVTRKLSHYVFILLILGVCVLSLYPPGVPIVSPLCPSASHSFLPFCPTGSEPAIYALSLAVNWLNTVQVFKWTLSIFFSFNLLSLFKCALCLCNVTVLFFLLSFACHSAFTSVTLHSIFYSLYQQQFCMQKAKTLYSSLRPSHTASNTRLAARQLCSFKLHKIFSF